MYCLQSLSAGLTASPWFSSRYLLISRSPRGFPVRNAFYLLMLLYCTAYGSHVGSVSMILVVGNWSLLTFLVVVTVCPSLIVVD